MEADFPHVVAPAWYRRFEGNAMYLSTVPDTVV